MDQGETVTLFNDMCLLAPAALIDKQRIQWGSGRSLGGAGGKFNLAEVAQAIVFRRLRGLA